MREEWVTCYSQGASFTTWRLIPLQRVISAGSYEPPASFDLVVLWVVICNHNGARAVARLSELSHLTRISWVSKLDV